MRVHYALHGVRCAIDAEPALAQQIAETVMPGCVRTRASGAPQAAFGVKESGGAFVFHRGRRRLWEVETEAELIPWVESEVVNWLLSRFRRLVHVHASVVERSGRAVVIAGAPDCGKTSLACALGLAGWNVMGDEVALIRPRDRRVFAFPRAMLVKSGTARRLPELRDVPARTVWLEKGAERVRYVAPRRFGRARASARIEAVVFPEWTRQESVSEIGELDALERLLRCTMNAEGAAGRAVKGCVEVVRQTRAFRLGVAKLADTAHLLSQAIGARR
jgi:hypothetical protein